ncbi:MAG: hypothetical protein LCH63_10800 [Candidatus Melainabacteria bacterium]|nr:hypothetical protein [Candidatus Melainabacteria bacterium]
MTALVGGLCLCLVAAIVFGLRFVFGIDLTSNLKKPILLLQTKLLPSPLLSPLKSELELAELELAELELAELELAELPLDKRQDKQAPIKNEQTEPRPKQIMQRFEMVLQQAKKRSLGNKEKARVYAGLGECKIRLGQINEGESDLKKASELDPDCALRIHERAYQALTMEDYEDGEFLETLAIKISPQVKYFFNRAVARYELCRFQEALQDFDAALAQGEPSKAETRRNLHRYRAQTLEALGRLDEALIAIKKAEKAAWDALQTSPDDLDLYAFYDEGLILARKGDFQALVARMQGIQKRRQDPVFQTLYVYGQNKLARQKNKDSLVSLDADEQIAVREFFAAKLETVLEALESGKACLKPTAGAMLMPPGSTERLRLLADIAYFAGQDCYALTDCARVSLQEGDYSRAIEELSRAEDLNGSVSNHITARLEYLKAQAYDKLGRKQEAQKAMQTAKDFGYKSPAEINLLNR